ncbi:dihydrolipoyl dehydrogenase [Candidatus Thorarchaeota archaeon]|nr:MAG: dihydrolipoyl dehydrogenase [Candidatus Thorarchaeota archaeon]
MKEYDLIVIGSGVGMSIASSAYEQGMRVAVVEHGPMGGTCLNRGCIPTKILTYVADIIQQAKHLENLGVKMSVDEIDYQWIMERMRNEVDGSSNKQGQAVDSADDLDWYKGTGEFIDEYTLEVDGEQIRSELIVLASGARPLVPTIEGIEDVEYVTNDGALHLMNKPKSMIIVGGGYIAAEFGHFFSTMGVEITILGRNRNLVKTEDEDVSSILLQELSERMTVLTNHEVTEAREKNGAKVVVAKNLETGEDKTFKADVLLIAAGRRSNADLFKPEKTGVKTDKHGWILVDDHFRTSKKGIWALGDAIGKHQFRHVANEEAQIAWNNIVQTLNAEKGDEPKLAKMDYHAVPRAVFSYPPIAAVGMTLKEAKETDMKLYVGEADYSIAAKGFAMGNPPSLVRVIVDGDSRRIVGASIVGPYSPILIQEIVNLMYTPDQTFYPMFQAMHIHPALPEVVQRAFGRLAPINGEHSHHH